MDASESEIALFIDTDLGTRFAIAVPPHISSAALKREVERVHFNCFPKLGEIKVHQFMVKRESCLYYLPETMLMKFTSWDVEGVRSLHVKVQPKNTNSRNTSKDKMRVVGKNRTRRRWLRKEYLSRPICRSVFALKLRRRKKKTSKNQLVKCMKKNLDTEDLIRDAENPDLSTMNKFYCIPKYEVEAASELSSEVMSVSGIINRYFPNFDEVSSVAISSPQFSTKRVQNLLPSPMASNGGRRELKRSKLGKRIVMASYKLGISPGKERPEISLCNSRGRMVQEFLSPSWAKSSCFEISDSED